MEEISCGLKPSLEAARLLGMWVQIPSRSCMSVSCECCVSSGSGLCFGLITRPAKCPSVLCLMRVMAKPRQLGGSRPI
jgi:hypothetical protein